MTTKKNKDEIIKKLISIVELFEKINRRDYSYFVDEIIERVAEQLKEGGEHDDNELATSTKAEAEEIINNCFYDMTELSDQLDEVGLSAEAVSLDRLRIKMTQDFHALEK